MSPTELVQSNYERRRVDRMMRRLELPPQPLTRGQSAMVALTALAVAVALIWVAWPL